MLKTITTLATVFALCAGIDSNAQCYQSSSSCGPLSLPEVSFHSFGIYCEGDTVKLGVKSMEIIDTICVQIGNSFYRAHETDTIYIEHIVQAEPNAICDGENTYFSPVLVNSFKTCFLGNSSNLGEYNIVVRKAPVPTISFLNDSVCTNDTPVLQPLYCANSDSAIFVWGIVGSHLVDTNEVFPGIIFDTPGTHGITLTITQTGMSACGTVSDTAYFTFVSQPSVEADIIENDYPTIQFSALDSSENARITWDFGDGTVVELPSVTHTFSNEGPHIVKLFVTNACSTDSAEFIINAPSTGISNSQKRTGVRIYPNPSNGEFNLNVTEKTAYSVVDVSGRLMEEGVTSSPIRLNLPSSGIYFLQTLTSGKTERTTLVVQ